MQFGDLTDELLDMGKEKAEEMAEGFLGDQEEEGGLKGAAAGYGKEMLDNVFGGGEDNSEGAASEADSGDTGDDDSNDDDSDDDK